jgi:hypothetical protein
MHPVKEAEPAAGQHSLCIQSGAMAHDGEVAQQEERQGATVRRGWRRRQRNLSTAASGGCWKHRLPVVWGPRDPSPFLRVRTGELLEKAL